MADLIDRQAVLSLAKDVVLKNGAKHRCIDATMVHELPSTQPEQPPYVAEIESEYRKAVNMPYIQKPLAKALYEVWKKHDRDDTERKE